MKEEIDLRKFFETLKNESDRGLVLLTSSILEIYLIKLFEKYLILDKKLRKAILEDSLAPLSTFSNKIKMAYSLGLIDKKSYKNLEYIRQIRNKFAHNLYEATFEDRQIIDWCNNIVFQRIPGYDPANYRHLFYDAAFFLSGYLTGRMITIEKQNYK